MKELTEKEAKFCEEYLKDFNGTRAAKAAGYAEVHANRQAYCLLRKEKIQAVLGDKIERRAKSEGIRPEYVLTKVTRTIDKAESEGDHNVVLKGCELLARHLGMFIERKEISGPNGDPIRYEQVKQAADAFTSAISSLIERQGEGPTPFEITGGNES